MHNYSEVHTKFFLCVGLLAGSAAEAQTPSQPAAGPTGASVVLPAVTVTAPRDLEAQPTDAASERRVSGETLNTRPIERPGEMLEAVPGLIVTQHSGEGKANQYFLRGFNLDHGTDLAIWLDGMPVNMRTHAHGQGYADVNFLIPELVESMTIRKGPYWASEGDFASAGSLHLAYADRLETNMLSLTGGSFGYWRGLAAGSVTLGPGTLTAAGELVRYDGAWQVPDATRKYNGFLRYSEGTPDNGFAMTALAYTNSWHSTDQIPQRAVLDGSLDRFGAVDQTDGGDAQRYSLSARWSRKGEKSASQVSGYFIYQTLNLYNDFTYFLDNPTSGDQFQQTDKRKILGLNASHTQNHPFLGFAAATTLGAQFRYDDIAVGLFNTVQRVPTGTVRDDHVSETSVGLYAESKVTWTDWLRSTIGVRGDLYWAAVDSSTAANSGQVSAFLASPKAGLVFGPFARTELYLNAGMDFHSNDVRGATITVDPIDKAAPQQTVPLLVRSRGAEIGARTQFVKGLDSALALFLLEFDSELVFVGDAGTTVPSRPSRRVGVEWTSRYRPMSWATFDLDLSYTQARFTDYDPAGSFIPGSPAFIAAAGIILGAQTGWFGGLRWRYFGARPLVEDGSVNSNPTSIFNARLGYVFDNGLKLQLDGFNIFNTQASQIDYYYQSRLRSEAVPVNDIHFHPVEPLALRFTVAKAF
jgi:TonB dependent receptor/TonB-dependent Receptor Plug Domain